MSPRYALLAEDSIVQAVPEHPKKENVFCLSNSFGDVYLFQVTYKKLYSELIQPRLTRFNVVLVCVCGTAGVHGCSKTIPDVHFFASLPSIVAYEMTNFGP